MQRFVTGGVLLAMLTAGLLLTLASCFPPYDPVSEAALATDVSFRTLTIAGREIHVAESGRSDGPLVLFIHGTPGSWQGYADYLHSSLRGQAHLVAMDRPGFGDSPAKDLPSLGEQSQLLLELADAFGSRPLVLVGHSLGGTIAYRMALDNPDLVDGLVVISSSIDPAVGKARWYNHLSDAALVRWMMPGSLRKANQEIMPLEEELTAMAGHLPELAMPVTVIHGRQDRLVSFANLEFAARHLPAESQRIIAVDDIGHFVLWERPELIQREISRLLGELRAPGAMAADD